MKGKGMSKRAQEFFEQVKSGEQVGMSDVMKGVGEFAKETFPGLSLSKILSDVGSELKQQAAHGAHEMASLLFRGDAFVMYPRTANEGQSMEGQGLQPEGQHEQSHVQRPEQEQGRGGREL